MTTEKEYPQGNGELEQFMTRAVHDLRSAVNSSTSLAQILRQRFGDELGEEGRWIAEQIVTQQTRLGDIISGILEFSHAAGTGEEPKSVALDNVVDQVLQNLQSDLQATGAKVTRQTLPKVLGHELALIAAIQNIVRNSIQYRSTETPRLAITATCDGSLCTVCVRDNGIGFSPEFREQIFEPFSRLHGSDSPGAGLGLAISRRIVEAHAGRIWADSQPGNGAAFWLTLPAAPG